MVTVGTVIVLGVEFEVVLVPRGRGLSTQAGRVVTAEGVETPLSPPLAKCPADNVRQLPERKSA